MKDWRREKDMFYGFRETLTEEQMDYLDSIQSNRMTISNSVSGSGKTTLAVAMAHYQNMKLIYIFFPVEEDKMGFRPGGQQEKESAYYGPLIDALSDINEDPKVAIEIIDEDQPITWEIDGEKRNVKWVKAMSHIFLRGRNIGKEGDVMVVIDEAQNGTKRELKKVLTRIHDNATTVVIGHDGQCDLIDPTKSGFKRVIEHFSKKWYCKVTNLTKNFRGELSRDADEL